ncbi:MAG: cytochrome c biogenesis protein CcsA, partial [Saprospiraceae bacterium]|nr:cytochrome c biogenesis protein CcsA [Saprospiraceae bacterium]
MKELSQHWWKLLGVIILLYVIVRGFTTPINPGVLNYTPNVAYSDSTLSLQVEAYNTHFDEYTTRVWLRLPNDSLLKAKQVEVKSPVHLLAQFDMPGNIDFEDKSSVVTSIIVDNEYDGYAIYPEGVRVKKGTSSQVVTAERFPLGVLYQSERFAFPFRNIIYETIRNTFFHVAIWFAMFLLLIYSCYCSAMYLWKKDFEFDMKSQSLTTVGIWFGIAGILTGSMWAKYTWGTFWTSDVKLNMSAVALLIYFAYWILRASIPDVDNRARIASVFNIFAFGCLMTLVMVVPR